MRRSWTRAAHAPSFLQINRLSGGGPVNHRPPPTLPPLPGILIPREIFLTYLFFSTTTTRFSEIREGPDREMNKEQRPEPLDFFIWTVEDVGLWLEEINLGSYRQIFKENGVNGEYLEGMSMFTTEQILRFIRRCHMKWGDFITLCKELRRIKVACLKGEQKVRRPWWAPSCLSMVFLKVAKRNRQSRVVSLKLEP
ncbi:unnamed protein product [Citrullus colocynthis]